VRQYLRRDDRRERDQRRFACRRVVEFVATPDPFTTNIAFGGDDMRTAWITLSGTGRLARCHWPRPGLRLAY
jgi:gluconolactonase